MSSRVKYTILITFILLIVIYFSARVVYYFPRHYLEMEHVSSSKLQSIANSFYVGSYVPFKKTIALNDGLEVNIPEAWVEHVWGYGVDLFFREYKKTLDGYNLVIPVSLEKAASASEYSWPLKYSLKLSPGDKKYTRRSGIDYSRTYGFHLFLDALPDTIGFYLLEKTYENAPWSTAVITDTLVFVKAFTNER